MLLATWVAWTAFFALLFAAEAVRLERDLRELDAMIEKLGTDRDSETVRP